MRKFRCAQVSVRKFRRAQVSVRKFRIPVYLIVSTKELLLRNILMLTNLLNSNDVIDEMVTSFFILFLVDLIKE